MPAGNSRGQKTSSLSNFSSFDGEKFTLWLPEPLEVVRVLHLRPKDQKNKRKKKRENEVYIHTTFSTVTDQKQKPKNW